MLQAGVDKGVQGNGRTLFVGNPGGEPGCEFKVYVWFGHESWEPADRGIETAFGNDLCSIN